MCIRFKTQGDIYGDGKREWPVEKESRDGGRGGSRLPIRFGEQKEESSWPRESGETQVLPGAAGHQCWPPPVPSSTNWDMGHNSE